MHVVATAGHVDHGKSTLVRALTGMEPDRWEEERRRGLTIDLGFAWTTLPSGAGVAFVDVPGHERFLANMLAGLGPAPVVMFVVAADEGWQAQSSDHRDVVAALGIQTGVVVLSRADRATPERVEEVRAQVWAELAGSGLEDAPVVTVSAVTGNGLDELRQTLDQVLSRHTPSATARLRLWVDRSFSVTGAGAVVTGTLTAGSISRGEQVEVLGASSRRTATVRRLESEGQVHDVLRPVSRVALNLRGLSSMEISRGDVILTPGSWLLTKLLDVRRTSGPAYEDVPHETTLHVGTAAVQVRVRPLDAEHARVTLSRSLPLTVGDRIVLRDPGSGAIGGALVLDAEPPGLRRRGDAARRAAVLHSMDPAGDVTIEVARRGAVREAHLRDLGLVTLAEPPVPDSILVERGWWVDRAAREAWGRRLHVAVSELHARDPLAVGLSRGALRDLLVLPSDDLVESVVAQAGLVLEGGYVRSADRPVGLGAAEAGLVTLEGRLAADPFAAPEADELDRLGLGPRELAAAERTGRLLRLGQGVVLLPTAPAQAMRTLAALDQPFTTSAARQALGTTRRVVIPLLEHLDGRGWTRRLDAGHRQVVR